MVEWREAQNKGDWFDKSGGQKLAARETRKCEKESIPELNLEFKFTEGKRANQSICQGRD
mgnify:CR=1 FL=1